MGEKSGNTSSKNRKLFVGWCVF